MGLDIVYEAAYGQSKYAFRAGSYSGFHDFRSKIAQLVTDGAGVEQSSEFFALLDHSDCDGELTQGQCEQLHHDFTNNRGAFERMVKREEDETDNQEWAINLYNAWTEWTGVCAKYGGRLVFA